jgi:hypothetical protein
MVAFFWCGLVIWSARLMAALLNSTSYFFTRWKRSHLRHNTAARSTQQLCGTGLELHLKFLHQVEALTPATQRSSKVNTAVV